MNKDHSEFYNEFNDWEDTDDEMLKNDADLILGDPTFLDQDDFPEATNSLNSLEDKQYINKLFELNNYIGNYC